MSIDFLDWIYDTNRNAIWQQRPQSPADAKASERTAAEVRNALAQLSALERRVIEMYHFDGRSIRSIAATLRKRPSTITNLHRCALKKLRKLLAEYAHDRYAIAPERSTCCICLSQHRQAIDDLIKRKRPEEPYGPLIREIRERFDLRIVSPQTILGHMKYH